MAKAPKDDTTTDPQTANDMLRQMADRKEDEMRAAGLLPPVDATAQDAASDMVNPISDAPDLSGPAPTPDAEGADIVADDEQGKADAEAAEKARAEEEAAQAKANAEAAAAAEAQAKADAAGGTMAGLTPQELQALVDEQAAHDREVAEAQAEADAEAAELAAQTAAEAPAVDVERLQLLIGQIERLNHTGHRLGLISELTDVYGMQVAQTPDEDALIVITMQGLSIDPAPDMETALTNWANAARRAIMAAAA